MRACLAGAVVIVAITGCDSSANEAGVVGEVRVERCTERFLGRVDLAEASEAEREANRRYVERTYCARFEREGWVHGDGALSIDAHEWLESGYACAAAVGEPGGEARTVPCKQLHEGPGPRVLDCALLHHVRRSEVQAYVAGLERRSRPVECDDGTPLAELGVP